MKTASRLALAVVAAVLLAWRGRFGSKIYFVEFDSDGEPGSGTQYHFSLTAPTSTAPAAKKCWTT